MNVNVLTKYELTKAHNIAYYYRHPERVSDYDKAILNKIKTDNPNIHYKALEINKSKYLSNNKRKNGVR